MTAVIARENAEGRSLWSPDSAVPVHRATSDHSVDGNNPGPGPKIRPHFFSPLTSQNVCWNAEIQLTEMSLFSTALAARSFFNITATMFLFMQWRWRLRGPALAAPTRTEERHQLTPQLLRAQTRPAQLRRLARRGRRGTGFLHRAARLVQCTAAAAGLFEEVQLPRQLGPSDAMVVSCNAGIRQQLCMKNMTSWWRKDCWHDQDVT